MKNLTPPMRVLTIQSHVIHGVVGNKAAVFPLQLFGLDVDILNTVQFSTHTGHGIPPVGSVLAGQEMGAMLESLNERIPWLCDYILTGYCKSAASLTTLASYIQGVKQKKPAVIYLMDPVLGDNGRLYVERDVISVYQSQFLPLADIITPNQYELQWLCDEQSPIVTVEKAISCINLLHQRYKVPIIILTSLDTTVGDNLILVGSKAGSGIFQITFPKVVDFAFTGSGDLFASLLLGFLHQLGSSNGGNGERHIVSNDDDDDGRFIDRLTLDDIKGVCERAVGVMQRVLERTVEKGRRLFQLYGGRESAQELEKLSFKDSRKYLELDITSLSRDFN